MDPLVLMTDVDDATARLLRTAEDLDPGAVGEPSLLPGWTVGHVLTHVARNADAYTNLLTWARTGVETPAYATPTTRMRDIEAGAGRPLREQIADIRAAHERFADAGAAMPAEAWTFHLPSTGQSAAAVPWARLREVEVHHVDLAAGYTPADWPDTFAHRVLHEVCHDLDRHGDAPALTLHPLETGHPLTLGGAGPDAPVVTGPAYALAAWLTGRSTGDGLTVSPDGPLPPVPAWM
jgi:maleylpyruvate isomerase